VQRRESARWREVLTGLIVGAQETGELRGDDPEVITEIVAGLIDGLSVHTLLYPERYSEDRLVGIIDATLALWTSSER
jgi:BetI-type transcriptional repressor, C-terminal